MALLKHAEFADKCGIANAALSVNKKRGKVIVREDGLIDDQDPVNKNFIARMLANSEKRKVKSEITPPGAGQSEETAKMTDLHGKTPAIATKKAAPIVDQSYSRAQVIKKLDADAAKAEVMMEKAQQEIRLLRIQEEKALGRVVPTDVVKSLFATHFKSMTTGFKQAIDTIAIEFAKKAKLNRNDLAEMKSQMLQALNRATDSSIEASRKSVDGLVTEYSQTKMKAA